MEVAIEHGGKKYIIDVQLICNKKNFKKGRLSQNGKILFDFIWPMKYRYPQLITPSQEKITIYSNTPSIRHIYVAKKAIDERISLQAELDNAMKEYVKGYSFYKHTGILYPLDRPTPVNTEPISDMKFRPYRKTKKPYALSHTPVWFTLAYKILIPCYKRIPGGTAYELSADGSKIWLYNRHTRLTKEPSLQAEGERVIKQVLHLYCNECRNAPYCKSQCEDIIGLVDKCKEVT